MGVAARSGVQGPAFSPPLSLPLRIHVDPLQSPSQSFVKPFRPLFGPTPAAVARRGGTRRETADPSGLRPAFCEEVEWRRLPGLQGRAVSPRRSRTRDDIRYVQEMLGHAKLSTTSIHTQVSIDRLKKVHEATHPGARLKRASETEQEKKG